MQTILVGPGRAGMAVAMAAHRAGHGVAGVLARTPEAAGAAARRLGSRTLSWDEPLPRADLIVLAVRDDAIADVAEAIAPVASAVASAVHLSGVTSTSALASLSAAGLAVGSFHPLQTMPTPEAGEAALEGAWVAVTAEPPLRETLRSLAESIGAHPFDLADPAKPIYHAAAAAAANFPLAALTMAEDLFAAAGVPFAVARPLVEAVIANAFALGGRAALTGPVARGDEGTVAAQLRAVTVSSPQWAGDFKTFVRLLARIAGREEDLSGVLS